MKLGNHICLIVKNIWSYYGSPALVLRDALQPGGETEPRRAWMTEQGTLAVLFAFPDIGVHNFCCGLKLPSA